MKMRKQKNQSLNQVLNNLNRNNKSQNLQNLRNHQNQIKVPHLRRQRIKKNQVNNLFQVLDQFENLVKDLNRVRVSKNRNHKVIKSLQVNKRHQISNTNHQAMFLNKTIDTKKVNKNHNLLQRNNLENLQENKINLLRNLKRMSSMSKNLKKNENL